MAKKASKIETGVPTNITTPLVQYMFPATAERQAVVIEAKSQKEAKEKFFKKYK